MGRFSFLKEIICHFTGTSPSVAEATQTYETAHTLTVSSLVVDLDFKKRHLVYDVIGVYDRELASRIVNADLAERDAIISEEINIGNLPISQARELIDAGIVTSKCIPISTYSIWDEPFSHIMDAQNYDENFSHSIFKSPRVLSDKDFDTALERMSFDERLEYLEERFTEQIVPYISADCEESYKRSR